MSCTDVTVDGDLTLYTRNSLAERLRVTSNGNAGSVFDT